MSSAPEARIYDFEGFRLDAARRQLSKLGGEAIQLQSRAFDVLLFMVQRPGEVLEKQAFMDAIWPKSVVEEGSLTQCIFALRRAFGDTATEHRFIATVPGRGYQFVAPVRTICATPASMPDEHVHVPEARHTPGGRSRRIGFTAAVVATLASAAFLIWPTSDVVDSGQRASPPAMLTSTIAVLPFADLSPNKDMEYFADGIADELITSLARVDNLRVIGRRSAFAFKGTNVDAHAIGEKLKVDSFLEGSVRKENDRLRISTQLTRTKDGVSLWSQTYDRKLNDVLDIQDSIAREVVAAMKPAVTHTSDLSLAGAAVARTENPEAYNAYLRGLYFYGRRTTGDFSSARKDFALAVELDPEFAMAHAWLARTYDTLAIRGVGDVSGNETLALAALDRAIKLEPGIADIWWVNQHFFQGHNAPLTMRAKALERALSVSPGDTDVMQQLANVYFQQGRRQEGLRALKRAYELDPLWSQAASFLGLTSYMFNADRELMLRLAGEITELAPTDPRGATFTAWVAMNEGRALDWDRSAAQAIAAAPRDQTNHVSFSIDYADLRIWDAALYHAKVAREVAPDSAAGWYSAAHTLMLSGDIPGARHFVEEAMKTKPGDYQALLAQAEFEYFTNDCTASVRSMLLARPAFGQPVAALDMIHDLQYAPILVWCQRQSGNLARATELVQVINLVMAPPTCPGLQDGILARVAAAIGDRSALIRHLTILDKANAMQLTFAPHEPMIQPFLKDAEVSALLNKLEARRAEWRRIVPKSSMRVPIPGIVAAN